VKRRLGPDAVAGIKISPAVLPEVDHRLPTASVAHIGMESQMTSISICRIVGWQLALSSLLCGVAACGPPNVLLIVCDDLNNHVGPAGYQHIRTPTLDRLAAASVSFQRAYCQYPVCGPSRASFLSGLYPESTGVLDNKSDIRQTRPGSLSMPQYFKDHGYWTAGVGKVFHTPKHQQGDLEWHAFHKFENAELPLVAAARKKFEAEYGSITRGKTRRAWKAHLSSLSTQTRGQMRPGYGPSGLSDEQHKDGQNVRQVANWLKHKPYGDRPFFIACGIQKPHVPFLAPDKYFARIPRSSLTYQLDPADDWDDIPRQALVKRFTAFGFELGRENAALRREYMQAYHACIEFVDTQLGLLIEEVKSQDLWEDTVIVFTSDHGYHLGEHFMWGKVSLFEVCARVPLMIRIPGRGREGAVSQSLAELVDLWPTLVDACGLKPPAHLQGKSLLPVVLDPRAGVRGTAYTVVTRRANGRATLGRAIRSDRLRYAEWPDGEELYDLIQDPAEHKNLSKVPQYQGELVRMRKLLAQTKRSAAQQAMSRSSAAAQQR